MGKSGSGFFDPVWKGGILVFIDASGKEKGKEEEGQRNTWLLRLSLRPSLWGVIRNAREDVCWALDTGMGVYGE